jgi:hypothetical protein
MKKKERKEGTYSTNDWRVLLILCYLLNKMKNCSNSQRVNPAADRGFALVDGIILLKIVKNTMPTPRSTLYRSSLRQIPQLWTKMSPPSKRIDLHQINSASVFNIPHAIRMEGIPSRITRTQTSPYHSDYLMIHLQKIRRRSIMIMLPNRFHDYEVILDRLKSRR